MRERFRRHDGDDPSGTVAVAERPASDTRRIEVDREPTFTDRVHDAHERQHAEFGGVNWGSAFFGFLVVAGMAALLSGILAAAGAATGLATDPTADGETLTVAGAIALFVALLAAYYAGGYVAGRMSRFDGARQGLGVWVWGLIAALSLGIAGAILGSEYNVLGSATNLPDLPVGERELTTGGIVASVAILLGTLLAAVAGGLAGMRYHRRVDRVGVDR